MSRCYYIEYKYILFTNNCEKLDPEIFPKSANFCDFFGLTKFLDRRPCRHQYIGSAYPKN